ncbi:unnamed protein product [Clonostachys byssicola]|uniref:Uncharacterized protein n=1 Tax=Clonostachys byssicola TaxID=160290 RepID=A0A9N9UDV5_9HYPO|nr:unnamed protein product [Clonostachys byssicola]
MPRSGTNWDIEDDAFAHNVLRQSELRQTPKNSSLAMDKIFPGDTTFIRHCVSFMSIQILAIYKGRDCANAPFSPNIEYCMILFWQQFQDSLKLSWPFGLADCYSVDPDTGRCILIPAFQNRPEGKTALRTSTPGECRRTF